MSFGYIQIFRHVRAIKISHSDVRLKYCLEPGTAVGNG
jgi:hypothetical protein